ncbi:hypothetical protein ACFLSQ_07895 [Bacteroidota bacterium]
MKKYLILLTLLLFAFSYTGLVADDEAVKGKQQDDKQEIATYKLKVSYKSRTFFTSTVSEVTHVHRIYPDSTTIDYSREVTYFLTTKVPSSPEDGFQTLLVSIDSLRYKFREGDAEFEYNTQDMQGNALRFKDLNCKTAPIGREFELVYSPYGDVARISGDELDETLDYVREKGEGYLKPVDMYIWINGLSSEHLEYLSDKQKIILPTDRIAKDSIWYSPVSIEFNGYSFFDTLAVKIVNYNAGVFNIEGQSTDIVPFDKESFTYNIFDLVKVEGAKGKGKFKIELKASGRVLSTEADYNINARIKVGEQYIEEQIKSIIKWKLIKIYHL